MSNFQVISIEPKDLPESVQAELHELAMNNDEVSAEMLSEESRQLIDEFIIAKVKDKGPTEEEKRQHIGANNELANLTVEAINRYLSRTDNLLLPFHVPGMQKDLLALYNACAHFVALYNATNVEHGECLQKVNKHE